jgi:hypothetical protein
MRAFDRDLIRGGHYGQQSCESRSQAEHMAAPTKPCDVKIVLANPEPSTWHDCDIELGRLNFRSRHLSGRIAETIRNTGFDLFELLLRKWTIEAHFACSRSVL